MVEYQKYINALRKCAKEHENDRTSTGHIIVSDLCKDTANLLEEVEQESRWIPVSEKLPNHDEYIKNNGLFNVSDGNRSYFGWFDIYDTKKFVKPTIAGFRVDNAVIAWMPLPKPCKAESEDKE